MATLDERERARLRAIYRHRLAAARSLAIDYSIAMVIVALIEPMLNGLKFAPLNLTLLVAALFVQAFILMSPPTDHDD